MDSNEQRDGAKKTWLTRKRYAMDSCYREGGDGLLGFQELNGTILEQREVASLNEGKAVWHLSTSSRCSHHIGYPLLSATE